METLAVADIPLIADMSVEEQVERAGEIITYMTLNFLAKNPSDRLTDFKRVSYDPTTQRSFYEMSVRAPYYPGISLLGTSPLGNVWFFGFRSF